MTAPDEMSAGDSQSAPEVEFLQSMALRRPRERRVALLMLIMYHGGEIMPHWTVHQPSGFSYWSGIGITTQELIIADLEYLASHDYLKREHFDRVHRCPGCSRLLLNFREICVSCGSSNLENLPKAYPLASGEINIL